MGIFKFKFIVIMSENIPILFFGCYGCLSFIFAIVLSSYVIDNQKDLFGKEFSDTTGERSQGFQKIAKAWTQSPFVDMKVIFNPNENYLSKGCPKEFPEEVLYKVWAGSAPYCDCTMHN